MNVAAARIAEVAMLGVLSAAGSGVDLVSRADPQQVYAVATAPAPPAEIAAARAQLAPGLAKTLDRVINASWSAFDTKAAQNHVDYIGRYWRLAGNSSYNAVIDRVRARLLDSGFADGKDATKPSVWIEEYPGNGHSWEYTVGTLAILHDGGSEDIVLSRARQQIALCVNSFSTPSDGLVAPLVDVGDGDRAQDYAGKDVTGAVVVGDGSVRSLWQWAVVARGAIGVVSSEMGGYVDPDQADSTRVTPHDQWDILQWGSVPYDSTRKAFGFKSTPRAAGALRAAAAAGHARVRVTIHSTFTDAPTRTLMANIPGRSAPNERVIIAAHVQEPGANDNGSGVATLTESARALMRNLQQHKFDAPERTMTFMWLDETAGSRQWIHDHPDLVPGVKYMFSTDMPGEDVKKTGGAFLVERYPDPAAVWHRPWDPDTEWGGGNVRANQLKGDLINDLHLAICERVARRSHWVVRSNPFEGGSDHEVYVGQGIPAVLDWHFTDRFYHTNYDTPDKTSREEMRNVGVSLTASAWLLASATDDRALAIAELVSRVGQARVDVETREGATLAAAAADPPASFAREATILQAWRRWYGEAVESVHRLLVGAPSADFDARVDALAAPFADMTHGNTSRSALIRAN